jgi:hypothetical protein
MPSFFRPFPQIQQSGLGQPVGMVPSEIARRLFSDDSDEENLECLMVQSNTEASIAQASVAQASVAQASVTQASIAQASVTQASVTQPPSEQTFVAPVFLEGCIFPGTKKIKGHRISDSVPDIVIVNLERNGDGPWKCAHCRNFGTIDGIFYSPCFQCASWGWVSKGVPYYPDDSETANNTYLRGVNLTVRPGDISTSN